MASEEAENYKQKGNDLFKEQKYEEAIKQYNKAIQLCPDNASYYSNRAACWSSKENHDSALADANRCLEKDPNFIKGYSRKGKALSDLGKFAEAEAAYKEGLAKEPGNAICQKGLSDVSTARRAQSSGSRSGAGGGLFGGLAGGGVLGQIIEKLKSGGKMQTYMLIMVAYFLFQNFTGRNKTAKGSDSVSETVAEDDDDVQAGGGAISRRFRDFDGMWLSYMQSESKSSSAVLMLHRTSLSAEAEFATAFPQLAKAAASSRLIAPDRPCHGFSPCPDSGEPADGAWLNKLVRVGGLPNRMAVVAVGREAAVEALTLARRRKEVGNLVIVSPKVVAPMRERMTKAEELHSWLKKNGYPESGQVAADAIRWAASGASDKKSTKLVALDVEKLSQECRVTILYDSRDEEDQELQQALESQGNEVKTRSITGDDVLADVLADEVQHALSPDADASDVDDTL
jgi:tetratricopeptide (TPR) repeat protein